MNLNKQEINRYSRHIQLDEIGTAGQEKLKQAKVLVIGAGGLGCPVLQYLTAAGVGSIGIVDFDVVEESNLQRQVLFNSNLIGRNKAHAAKEQLEKLNPFVKLIPYPIKLDYSNALSLFEQYNLIVDATDNFESRYLISDAALLSNKPIVFGAIHKFEGQVTVFNHNGGPTYRCLFPKHPKAASIPNCNEVGVVGVLPGIVGTYQANEVLKVLLRIGETLSGKLMLINTLSNSTSTIGINRNEQEIEKVLAQKNLSDQYALSSETSIEEISVAELKKRINQGEYFDFLDVREVHEQPKIEKLSGINLPIQKLKVNNNKILTNNTLISYCQTGIRSKKAIKYLQEEKGFTNILNLQGGIQAWLQYETQEEQMITKIS